MNHRAIFLDKDGTVVVNVPYNVNPELIELMPGVIDGLLQLQAAGFMLIMISNQAGLAHGYFTERQLMAAQRRLESILAEPGISLRGFFYCPHHPQGSVAELGRACECRKPSPGLIKRAALEHGIDLAESWFIGDILDDVEAGNRAGCKTVLVDSGTETGKPMMGMRRPHFKCSNMNEAVDFILAQERTFPTVSR